MLQIDNLTSVRVSLSTYSSAGAPKSYVNRVHIKAWKEGLKGLYYLRTEAKSRAENVSEKVERVALQDDNRSIVYSKKRIVPSVPWLWRN